MKGWISQVYRSIISITKVKRRSHKKKIDMYMVCLFHYDLSVANVYRYCGNNYTGEYRPIKEMEEKLRGHVDDDLIAWYIRVMTVGAPTKFNHESTRENTMLYWRQGNATSIKANLSTVVKALNKLEQHNFAIVYSSWISRFITNIFFTPHHILVDKGKRLIFDAKKQYTPTSVPVNRMTSTKLGVELECQYGTVLEQLLIRIWNLRIMYPDKDIVLHANDVKSCFRQMQHHPDVMGAFSYIIGDLLYTSCGLTFGADFSPSIWEIC